MSSLKDREANNAYMRVYMAARYQRRRTEVLRRLGAYCWECYDIGDDLQIDHIDPSDKRISWKRLAGMAEWRLEAEIQKCQLLCPACHHDKSTLERGLTIARGTHGTISAYRYCGPPKCDACKAAKANVHQKWRRKIGP